MASEPTEVWLPPFQLVPLLTPEECKSIITQSPVASLHPATRVSEEDPTALVVDEVYRTALTRKFEPGDPTYELVLSRVLEKLPEINASFGFRLHEEPHRLLPAIMINRYDTPGHHGWHTDTGGHPATQERKLSIVIGLSPPGSYAGGFFNLLDGNSEFPLTNVTEGTGAVFHSLMLHRLTPMVKGTRYSCVLWLLGPRFT